MVTETPGKNQLDYFIATIFEIFVICRNVLSYCIYHICAIRSIISVVFDMQLSAGTTKVCDED